MAAGVEDVESRDVSKVDEEFIQRGEEGTATTTATERRNAKRAAEVRGRGAQSGQGCNWRARIGQRVCRDACRDAADSGARQRRYGRVGAVQQVQMLARCLWPPRGLHRHDGAECRRGELRAGHVRAAGRAREKCRVQRRACAPIHDHRGGRARSSTASSAAAPRSSPSGWRTLRRCARRGGRGGRRGGACAHTVEVARGRGRPRRPGAHGARRGGRGRRDGRRERRGAAAERCWRGGYRGRRALRLLPPCLWPPTRLRRRDGAECRHRGVQHGAVRAAEGERAWSRSEEQRGGRGRTATA